VIAYSTGHDPAGIGPLDSCFRRNDDPEPYTQGMTWQRALYTDRIAMLLPCSGHKIALH